MCDVPIILSIMPELAEVEFYRKQWLPLLGRKVSIVRLHPGARVFRSLDPGQLRKQLIGKSATKALAHGKQMFFRFQPCGWLGIHLGMSGSLAWRSGSVLPGPHDHLVLQTVDGAALFHDPRMFGQITWHAGPEPPSCWTHRPPGLLDAGFTSTLVRHALQRHARAPVKAVLLRQEIFPGIGNWMADEILWRCALHPALPAAQAADHSTLLWKTIRQVARDALRVIGRDWSDPPRTWLFPHRWKNGGICPMSGATLVRETIAGRTTCWSPARQKLPRPCSLS